MAVVLTRRPFAADGSLLSPLSRVPSLGELDPMPLAGPVALARESHRSTHRPDMPSGGSLAANRADGFSAREERSPPRPADDTTTILVVDDEDDLRELVRYNLAKAGFRVACAATGEEALASARRQPPSLIVLDLMLPAIDGLEVCRRLKADAKTREIPIIMLTAKTEESDVVRGLERGADDYITKPFSPRVLTARVKALLRRQEVQRESELEVTIDAHELSIHPGRHEVTLAGKSLDLTFTEFSLLAFLAKRPGWAYTRTQIVDAVKGEDYPVTERSVDVQVAGLRKKLGDFGSYIETVRGVGYRFRA